MNIEINNILISNTQKRISNIIEQIYNLNTDIILLSREDTLENITSLDIKDATYHLRMLLDDLEIERKI